MESSRIATSYDFVTMSKPEILAILVSSKLIGKEDLSEQACDMIRNLSRKKNNTIHDTSLLLKQYRYIQYAVNANTFDLVGISIAESRAKSGYQEIIDALKGFFCKDSNFVLQRGTRGQKEDSARRIVYCLEYLKVVDDALEILRRRPNKGVLFYKIIYYTFIDSEINSYNDRQCGYEAVRNKLEADGEFLSQTTYYRQKKQAIEAISPLLWNVVTDEMLKEVLSSGIHYL